MNLFFFIYTTFKLLHSLIAAILSDKGSAKSKRYVFFSKDFPFERKSMHCVKIHKKSFRGNKIFKSFLIKNKSIELGSNEKDKTQPRVVNFKESGFFNKTISPYSDIRFVPPSNKGNEISIALLWQNHTHILEKFELQTAVRKKQF